MGKNLIGSGCAPGFPQESFSALNVNCSVIEVQATKFVSDEFNNWRAGESRIKMHENNSGFPQAILTFANRPKEAGRIDYLALNRLRKNVVTGARF